MQYLYIALNKEWSKCIETEFSAEVFDNRGIFNLKYNVLNVIQ